MNAVLASAVGEVNQLYVYMYPLFFFFFCISFPFRSGKVEFLAEGKQQSC